MASRTHISVSSRTYDAAKRVQREFRKAGFVVTMEEALFEAKMREKSPGKTKETGVLGGWRI